MAKPKRSVIRKRKKKCRERNQTSGSGTKHKWRVEDGVGFCKKITTKTKEKEAECHDTSGPACSPTGEGLINRGKKNKRRRQNKGKNK